MKTTGHMITSLWHTFRRTLVRLQQSCLYPVLKVRQIGPHYATGEDAPERLRVYALLSPSWAEKLVLDRELVHKNWHQPLSQPKPAQLSDVPAFFHVYRRGGKAFHDSGRPVISKSLKKLVAWHLKHPEIPIDVVPVRVFWGRSPDKEGSFWRIWLQSSSTLGGRLTTVLAMLINGRDTFIHFSRPVALSRFHRSSTAPDRVARMVAMALRQHHRLIESVVIGPELSHRRTLVKTIPSSQPVRRVITESGEQKKKATKQARRYADEIASNVSHTTVRFMDVLLKRVWHSLYDGVHINHIEQIKLAAREHTVVYLPCHRSHIDYLLLSYVLYHHGLQVPQVAAGINLNLPIVGGILRRGGAFFIRRSFKDNRLYSAVFDEYLHQLFSRGYPVEYFVEGGRSRTGRTLPARAGLLSMTVRSYLRSCSQGKPPRKNILLVPVHIGYEKVFEASSYHRELSGAQKRKESIGGIFSALRAFGKPFGQVHLSFGSPIHLGEFMHQQKPGWYREDLASSNFRPQWATETVNRLANRIVTEINRATSVNPINLIALVLLSSRRQALAENTLLDRAERWRNLIQQCPVSDLIVCSTTEPTHWLERAEQLELVERHNHPMGDLIKANPRQALDLTYYRNNALHLLALPSLMACLLIHQRPLKQSDIQHWITQVYPFVQSELFLPWSRAELPEVIGQWLNAFNQMDYCAMSASEEETSCQEFIAADDRTTAYSELRAMARLMMPTLQRYFLTIELLRQRGNGMMSRADTEQQSSLVARKLTLLYEMNSPEFFDKQLFHSLLTQLIEEGLVLESRDQKLGFGGELENLSDLLSQALDGDVQRSVLECLRNG